MADTLSDPPLDIEMDGLLRIRSFEIEGLFGGPPIQVRFPQAPASSSPPSIIILSGRNGTGKTTILRMISGLLNLNFDTFRAVPFSRAKLVLSNNGVLEVKTIADPNYPLWMSYNGIGAKLPREKGDRESAEHNDEIRTIRAVALPHLRQVSYELLELDRTPRRDRLTEQERHYLRQISPSRLKQAESETLTARISNFIRDAQVNYRRFFRAEELGYLPRLLDRLKATTNSPTTDDLIHRLHHIRARHLETRRFGLLYDEEEISALEQLIRSENYTSVEQLAIIETYVENAENAQRGRDLISNRLISFERIMEDFLIGKSVSVERKRGLVITSELGVLNEEQLSSGEFHFLYMMVAALLCQQVGTVIAIDEPELSLHVSWQRKLIAALMECAAGASPTFLFATHSLVISAEHRESVQNLSAID